MEICHIFQFVEPQAPERTVLNALGLVESFERPHPGQGTANLCYCFDNAYIELLWVENPIELTSPDIERTRLAERARWQTDRTCPFGIGVRLGSNEEIPFATWPFQAPYFPDGFSIPVALESEDPTHPFFFVSPGQNRPDQWQDGRSGARQAAAGFCEITTIRLEYPAGSPPGGAAILLAKQNLIELTNSSDDHYRMTLLISKYDGVSKQTLNLPVVSEPNTG